MDRLIQTRNVSFFYLPEQQEEPTLQDMPVLEDINLSIAPGEFVAVLGHNGSGKSTLAKHFNAILLPTYGEVLVDGKSTKEQQDILAIRQKIGMVFQNPDNQIVATIVEEDVAFALENLGMPPEEIRVRVDQALEAVDMKEFANHASHQLSGGQKQRIAIAGVLAMQPACIVLDEPTAMLDPKGRREVLRTVKELNHSHKATVVLITHYMEEAVHADRVIVIDHGKNVLEGTPRQVFSQVETMKQLGLDVPQATELCYRLRRQGYPIPEDVLTQEECVQALHTLWEKGEMHH